MPNGAYVTAYTVDYGIPIVQNTATVTTGCAGSFAYSQVSDYYVQINGVNVGEVRAATVATNGLGRPAAWGSPENFNIGTQTGDIEISLESRGDMSITYFPFLQINGFADALCDDSQCENGGTCADAWGSSSCEIADQPGLWMGVNTSEPVVYCYPDSCMNGGTCVENEMRFWNDELGGPDNTTYCDCSTATSIGGNYWGEWCQYSSPCDTNPCLNDGVCTQEGDSKFSCDCSGTVSPHTTNEPFTGIRCEMSGTTPCDLNPCLNGGLCEVDTAASGGFLCNSCSNGWTGHTCQIPPPDMCGTTDNSDYCGRYGVCVPSNDESLNYVQCVCLWGYSGTQCTEPNAACAEQNCQNDGVCVALNDGATAPTSVAACLCVDPWVGDKCQWNSTVFAAPIEA
jgi:hypothetical protein